MVNYKQANGSASREKYQNGSTVTAHTKDEATDIQRWRLLDERGRQTWHYLETDEEVKTWPQSTADRYHLGLPLVSTISNSSTSEGPQLTDKDLTGPTRPSTTHDSPRLRSECPCLLLSSTAPTRQLGVRVWRSYVPPPRLGRCMVCHEYAYTETDCHRDEAIPLCQTKPQRWRLGSTY